MSSSKSRFIYWDSCVFLAYINEEPERVDIIEALWQEVIEKKAQILTSTLSIVEVAWSVQERDNRTLSSDAEERINAMWDDPSIKLVEATEIVMRMARDLARSVIPQQWSLKPADAIHLATAMWVDKFHDVSEFHTYDDKLERFSASTGFVVRAPHVLQLPLPYPRERE